MKTHCSMVLLFTLSLIIHGSQFIVCQEPNVNKLESDNIFEAIEAHANGQISQEESEQKIRKAFRAMYETRMKDRSPQEEPNVIELERNNSREALAAFQRGEISLEELAQRLDKAVQAIREAREKSPSPQKTPSHEPTELIFKTLHVDVLDDDPYEEPIEESTRGDYGYYSVDNDGNRYYHSLQAHGDYSQLKFIIRAKKMDFYRGEHIYVKFYVRNDSDSKVHIKFRHPASCDELMKLFHSNDDEAVKTPKWEEEFQKRKSWNMDERFSLLWRYKNDYIKLQPGQEWELDGFDLDDYYVLTEPDTYELTCFLMSFIFGQEYEPPLQSNTLTFRILETPVAEDYWYRDGTQRGGEPQYTPYTNPPPGEEVFMQPKPPKNVFYIYTRGVPSLGIINVSPYTYYRQKAKEAEAAK